MLAYKLCTSEIVKSIHYIPTYIQYIPKDFILKKILMTKQKEVVKQKVNDGITA